MFARLRLPGILLCCAACSATYAQDKLSLLEAWEDNWGQIQDLEVVFEETAYAVNPDEAGLIPYQLALLRWNGTHLRSRVERPAQAITWDQSYDFVTETGMRLHTAPGLARPMGWINLEDFAASALGLEWLSDQLRAPGLDVAQSSRYGQYASLSVLLQDPLSRLRPEPATVDGRSTWVLDVYSDTSPSVPWMTVWLDPHRSAMPVQWVLLDSRGTVRFACRLREYCEYDGIWLPSTIERWLGSGFPATGLIAVRCIREVNSAPQIRLNSGLTPVDCSVEFPPGAVVMDDSDGEGFVVVGDGRLAPMSEVFARTERTNLKSASAGPGGAELTWLGLAGMLGFGSVFAARFLARR